jgi:dATP/dGTP diphosphohydrolase
MATSRLDLSLFPQTAIAYGALAFTEGDLKYGGYNWRVAGVSANVYVAALLRHVFKWYNGEWADPKTGVPHLASVLACNAVLVDAIECGKLNDDRPPKSDVTRLLNEFENRVKHLQSIFPNGVARFTAIPPKSLSHGTKKRAKSKRFGGKSKKVRTSHASQTRDK